MRKHPVMAGGGHVLHAMSCLAERIEPALDDLLCPVDSDEGVRSPTVHCGYPPLSDRDVPLAPLVALRAGSVRQAREDGDLVRRAGIVMTIGVYVQEQGDELYAWAIYERICRALLEQQILAGKYIIEPEVDCEESVELTASWGAYVLQATVPVILPAILNTEDEYGETINAESVYEEPEYGAGIASSD